MCDALEMGMDVLLGGSEVERVMNELYGVFLLDGRCVRARYCHEHELSFIKHELGNGMKQNHGIGWRRQATGTISMLILFWLIVVLQTVGYSVI